MNALAMSVSRNLPTHLVVLLSIASIGAVACGGQVDLFGPGREPDPEFGGPAPIAPAPHDDPYVGELDGPMLLRVDGTPSGDGASCALDGVAWGDLKPGAIAPGLSLRPGEDIALADGCSMCRCTRRGLSCETNPGCKEVRAEQTSHSLRSCTFRHAQHATGDVFVAGDACGSICSCSDGQVDCNARSCSPNACPAAPKPPPGMSCADVVVTARAPDGTCCTYPNGCGGPDGWPIFTDAASCLDSK